jgi:predicted cupin superfamily sugar epimerase
MDARAADLIARLGLRPHPEGGFFRELYRSSSAVQPLDARPERTALTTIYFLLPAGEVSRWHRVTSDEVWHFFDGDPLELFTMDPSGGECVRHLLGPVASQLQPEHVVPANAWQAARSTGRYSLVGCVVGPGFDFADFAMLRDCADDGAAAIERERPDIAPFL